MTTSFYLTAPQYIIFKEYLVKNKNIAVSEKSTKHNLIYITVMGDGEELIKINNYYSNLIQ